MDEPLLPIMGQKNCLQEFGCGSMIAAAVFVSCSCLLFYDPLMENRQMQRTAICCINVSSGSGRKDSPPGAFFLKNQRKFTIKAEKYKYFCCKSNFPVL